MTCTSTMHPAVLVVVLLIGYKDRLWTMGIHGVRIVCKAGEANAAEAKGKEGQKGL
jgi:hypothetical protein